MTRFLNLAATVAVVALHGAGAQAVVVTHQGKVIFSDDFEKYPASWPGEFSNWQTADPARSGVDDRIIPIVDRVYLSPISAPHVRYNGKNFLKLQRKPEGQGGEHGEVWIQLPRPVSSGRLTLEFAVYVPVHDRSQLLSVIVGSGSGWPDETLLSVNFESRGKERYRYIMLNYWSEEPGSPINVEGLPQSPVNGDYLAVDTWHDVAIDIEFHPDGTRAAYVTVDGERGTSNVIGDSNRSSGPVGMIRFRAAAANGSYYFIDAGPAAPAPVTNRDEPQPEGKILLVEDSKARCSIVISAQATEKEQLAAEELQSYLEKMVQTHHVRTPGARARIITDDQNPTGTRILIGRNRFSDDLNPDTGNLGLDGYLIQVVGSDLVLKGQSDQGTLNAVYGLLEEFLGVRWFMPGGVGEDVPHQKTIALPRLNERRKPDFWALAGLSWVPNPGVLDWERRNRTLLGPSRWSIDPCIANVHFHRGSLAKAKNERRRAWS